MSRRYRSKGEVVLDALVGFAFTQLPDPDTGSLRGDLPALLTAPSRAGRGVAGDLNRALAVEALQDDEFAARLWHKLIAVRREAV
ncbi:TetR family transcriptional regulator, partial [Streptomyces tateyamensis]